MKFFYGLLVCSAWLNVDISAEVPCPTGKVELVKDLSVTLDKNSTSCPGDSGFKCIREQCVETALEKAFCTYNETSDGALNWTCSFIHPEKFEVVTYLLKCPSYNLTDKVCIDEECCSLYYDIVEETVWYKSWTAIAIITAIVILVILLAMLVLHCKTVLKSFHNRRRQASESFSRVAFTK